MCDGADARTGELGLKMEGYVASNTDACKVVIDKPLACDSSNITCPTEADKDYWYRSSFTVKGNNCPSVTNFCCL